MKQLIVSADDFGLTKSINEGIVKAYKEGIATSINLLSSGEAFEDAINLIRDLKLENIGAHLCLTETIPVTDPEKIPSLVAKGNRFYKNHNILFGKFILGLISEREVYTELESQLCKIERIGIEITNLSSHEHIHMMPKMLDIFLRLAEEHNIPFIRYPRKENRIIRLVTESGYIYKSFILSCLGRGMKEILGRYAISYTDYFLGFLDSGRLREDVLIDMLKSLKDGTTELVCHPGFLGPEILDRYKWHINCEEELFSLTSSRAKKIIEEQNIQLISYQELLANK